MSSGSSTTSVFRASSSARSRAARSSPVTAGAASTAARAGGRLTLDHVIPRSKGGDSTWENVVTSCAPCNLRKGNRLPHEVQMELPARPRPPAPVLFIRLATPKIPQRWEQYLGPSRPRRRRDGGLGRALDRQLRILLPLRPRAGVQAPVAPGEVEAVQRDAGRDARAAVGDELVPPAAAAAPRSTVRSPRPGSGPARGRRRSARPRQRGGLRASTTTSSPSRRASSSPRPIVSSVRSRRRERRGLDRLLAARAAGPRQAARSSTAQSSWPKCRRSHQSRSAPPSEPYATTKRALADAGPAGGRRERPAARQRMAAVWARLRGEVPLDVEERRPGDVRLRGRPAARLRDRRATSGNRRSGSACVTGNQSGGVGRA